MTATDLIAEMLRNLSIIAEDENLLRRATKYLHRLAVEKKDPTQMPEDEFFAMLIQAERDIADGKGITFTDITEMNAWLNSL